MPLELKQSSPQVTDSTLRQPGEFPEIPQEVIDRFPSMGTWMDETRRFWRANVNAVDEFARAIMDVTEVAGVLVVDPNAASLYIKRGRGPGKFNDADTPFFVDRDGRFSLGTSVVWEPSTDELTVSGTIIATGGEIGGFVIGADFIRDNANSFGLASTITGGNDVRFWAGDTFANRATAPLRFYENGTGVIAGFTVGASTLSAGAGITAISISTSSSIGFSVGDLVNGPFARVIGDGTTYGFFSTNDLGNDVVQLYALNITSKSGQLRLADSTGTVTISGDGSTGAFQFGTFTAIGDTPVVGWVTHTDVSGAARRLAVV